jgi:hypothetical protein
MDHSLERWRAPLVDLASSPTIIRGPDDEKQQYFIDQIVINALNKKAFSAYPIGQMG